MPRHWSDGPIWSFDTETTGLDPRCDRIIAAALVYVEPDGRAVLPSYSCIIDPGVPVPEAASAVNGLTTERVRADGVDPAGALRHIVSLLLRVRAEGGPLVIVNAPFDWPFLIAECERHDIQAPPRVAIFDPLVVDRHTDPYRKGSRRLEAMAAHYGVTLDGAHEAGADAIAAVGVTRALLRRNESLLRCTPEKLHQEQVGWYAAWRDEVNAYWARRGETRRVTGEWPTGDAAEEPAAKVG